MPLSVMGLSLAVTASAPGAGIPTGDITFEDGSNVLGTAALNGSGVATLSIATLTVAPHSISASRSKADQAPTVFAAAASATTPSGANRATTTRSAAEPLPEHRLRRPRRPNAQQRHIKSPRFR